MLGLVLSICAIASAAGAQMAGTIPGSSLGTAMTTDRLGIELSWKMLQRFFNTSQFFRGVDQHLTTARRFCLGCDSRDPINVIATTIS
jgi:hypothetical protein